MIRRQVYEASELVKSLPQECGKATEERECEQLTRSKNQSVRNDEMEDADVEGRERMGGSR